jgi:hypothetical protein
MRPLERRSLDALLAELGRWGEGEGACALGARLGTPPETTGRLLAVGVPLVLVALVRHAATSHGTDLLPTTLDRASRSAPTGLEDAASDAAVRQADSFLGHLLGARRGALEAQLERLAGADRASVGRALEAVALPVLDSLARARKEPGPAAREVCRELGAALGRAEDAVPGSIGAFEELLDGGAPPDEDLVRIGRLLLGSLAGPPRRKPG